MSVHFKLRAEIYNRWNILYGYMFSLIQAIGGQFYMIQYKRCSDVNIDLVYVDNDLKGSLCVNEQGKISFIFVDKGYRNIGVGMKLLQVAREELNLSSLSIGFPNNNLLEGFLKKCGFEKNSLAQYEMYLLL